MINVYQSIINPKEDINEIIEYNNQPENNLNDNDNDFSKILINFEYNCNCLEIQCNLKEKMKDIILQNLQLIKIVFIFIWRGCYKRGISFIRNYF